MFNQNEHAHKIMISPQGHIKVRKKKLLKKPLARKKSF